MFETVKFAVQDGIATISLNRPNRLNAINATLLRDLSEALRLANGNDEAKVIILTGEGRAFCAGDDLKEIGDERGNRSSAKAYIESIQDITRAIVLNEKIVIGAVQGWAVGGGLEWTINCDLVIAAEDARFFFPETSLGVFVTGAVTALLPQMIGLQRAKKLILLGERFDARQARAMGFDWDIVAPEALDEAAAALARRVTNLPQGSVRHLKRVFATAPYIGVEAAMGLETEATVEGFLDPENVERARRAMAGGTDG